MSVVGGLQEMSRTNKSFGLDQNNSLPRVLMVEKFREGESGLQKALQTGQLFEFVADGIAMVGYRQVSSGEERSKTTQKTISEELGFSPIDRVALLCYVI